jgi:hypothetical protein
MEVIVLKSFMFGGQPAPVGSIVDLPPVDAAYVIALKRAEPVTASPEDAATIEADSGPGVDAPKAPKTRKAKAS